MWDEVGRCRIATTAAAVRAAGAVHYAGCATAAPLIHKRKRYAKGCDAIYAAAAATASFFRPFSARSSCGEAARSGRRSRQGSE